jgi:gamma-glutamylputrescine oxidase
VVGAGYTGLSAALELAERGYGWWCWKPTGSAPAPVGRNGGVLGMGQRKDQDELERWLGGHRARAVATGARCQRAGARAHRATASIAI